MTTGTSGAGAPGRPVVVDPRMRSRRIEVQRHAGRRRLRRVLAVAGTLGALAAVYGLARSPVLDVDHVRATGGEHTGAAAVATAAAIERGEPMLTLDTGAVARRVEALPWVDEARIERRWPGTVRISVTERTPAAVVPLGEDRSALVDLTGRVLDVGQEPPADLVRVSGLQRRPDAGESLGREGRDALAVVGALGERLPGGVVEVTTDLEAGLALGGRVRFGTVDDLEDKVVAVETVLADVDLACLGVLDVRVPSNPVLTRIDSCS